MANVKLAIRTACSIYMFVAASVLFCSRAIIAVDDLRLGNCVFANHKTIKEADANRLRPFVGYSWFADDDLGYSYHISICKTVDLSRPRVGATQRNKTSPATVQSNIIGAIDKAELMVGTNWLMLEYKGGETYGHHCGSEEKRTLIMMMCKPGSTTDMMRVIEENNMKTQGCYYLFEVDHELACPPVTSSLSIGSVICIIFACLVALYLIGGFIYQRLVVGAKGYEQIPNYNFWQDFGNLQADGCDLVCRRGLGSPQSRQYRGLGDDQIQTHEEEDQDEHLLPM